MTEGRPPIEALVAAVPEFREHYPLTLVMDAFSDRLRDAIREGASPELVDRCLAFVEDLAASDEQRIRNLVTVCFLEAAMWGELGVSDRFGPATRRLVAEA